MSTYVLTVNGVSKRIREDSVDIRETTNSRNLMNCAIASLDGTYRPALRDEVILTEDGIRIFLTGGMALRGHVASHLAPPSPDAAIRRADG